MIVQFPYAFYLLAWLRSRLFFKRFRLLFFFKRLRLQGARNTRFRLSPALPAALPSPAFRKVGATIWNGIYSGEYILTKVWFLSPPPQIFYLKGVMIVQFPYAFYLLAGLRSRLFFKRLRLLVFFKRLRLQGARITRFRLSPALPATLPSPAFWKVTATNIF